MERIIEEFNKIKGLEPIDNGADLYGEIGPYLETIVTEGRNDECEIYGFRGAMTEETVEAIEKIHKEEGLFFSFLTHEPKADGSVKTVFVATNGVVTIITTIGLDHLVKDIADEIETIRNL